MICLGLSNIYGHEPSACLVENNKIVAMAEEERFVNIKHAPGHFPTNAVKFCLNSAGLKLSDVDIFTHNWKVGYKTCLLRSRSVKDLVSNARYYYLNNGLVWKAFKRHLKIVPKKLELVEHHLAHASSAYHLSGFKDANIITLDGSGERACTLLAYGKDGNIEKLKEFFIPNSLGSMYTSFTEYLGYKPDNDEGTVMALASFGKDDGSFDNLCSLAEGSYRLAPLLQGSGGIYSSSFLDRFGKTKKEDMAFGIQRILENVVIHLAKWMYDQNGCKNFCLAGGVALNCRMNGALLQQDFVDDIYIQPAANDAGGSIGSAVYCAVQNGSKFDKMEHVYYGPSFLDEEIEKALIESKMPFEKTDNPSAYASDLLLKGKIVGWFQDRMECGPRALGNRSMLADPRDPKMKDIINFFVKHRESFRPFCPSVLKEESGTLFKNKKTDSPFMVLSFDIKDEFKEKVPAILHIDNSARVQDVDKKTNPKYHELIKRFSKGTGVPMVLNTSLNDSGQPIVRTPSQAIKLFYGTGMDAMVIGDYVIGKS